MRTSEIETKINTSSDLGTMFKINFAFLFLNTICELNKPRTCKNIALTHLIDGLPIRDLDWCVHIIKCIMVCKQQWDLTDRTHYFCGPVTVLLVRTFYIIHYDIFMI